MRNTLALVILSLGLASVLQAHSVRFRRGDEEERSHGEYYEKREAQYGVYPADTYPLVASSPVMVVTPPEVHFTYNRHSYFPLMAHPPSVQNSFFPQAHITGHNVVPTQAAQVPDISPPVVQPKVEEAEMKDILGLRSASDEFDDEATLNLDYLT